MTDLERQEAIRKFMEEYKQPEAVGKMTGYYDVAKDCYVELKK